MSYELKLQERGPLNTTTIGCVRVLNGMPQTQAEGEIQSAFSLFRLNRVFHGGNFAAYLARCWPTMFADAKSVIYATATVLVG